MIKLEYLRDCAGASRFGTCMGCGKWSHDDSDMVRVKIFHNISDHFQGVSLCLCQKCYKELKDAMLKFEEGVKGCLTNPTTR